MLPFFLDSHFVLALLCFQPLPFCTIYPCVLPIFLSSKPHTHTLNYNFFTGNTWLFLREPTLWNVESYYQQLSYWVYEVQLRKKEPQGLQLQEKYTDSQSYRLTNHNSRETLISWNLNQTISQYSILIMTKLLRATDYCTYLNQLHKDILTCFLHIIPLDLFRASKNSVSLEEFGVSPSKI